MSASETNGTPPKRIAVIGGGITGLAAAHRLINLDSQVRVTLFEGSERLGGIIQTVRQNGFLIELGPDSFITNKPGAVTLCEEIGFSDQLIPTDESFRRSLVLRKGRPLAGAGRLYSDGSRKTDGHSDHADPVRDGQATPAS